MRSTLLVTLALCCMAVLHAQEKKWSADRKLPPALQQELSARKAGPDQPATWWVQTSHLPQLRSLLSTRKWPVHINAEHPAGRLLVVQTTRAIIDSLLLSPLVLFIDRPRKAVEELRINGFDQSVNRINAIHHLYPSFNGNGLTVSVKENKFDTADIDFKGRVLNTPLASTQISSHASIMSTIIAGGGNSHYTGKGAASGARITSADFGGLLPNEQSYYEQYQVSVQNHSYGSAAGIENYYGADAAAYDGIVNTLPSLLHVFSAGNSGDQTGSDGPYAGVPLFANLTGSFKMAKNIITVGHVDSFMQVLPRSSRGPAYDGRVKPELVAFGEDGSSGAAAIVSGIGLVLQHAYQAQHAGTLPPATLVKAILLNSADDLSTPGPDFRTGFGNANALQAMQTLEQNRYELNTVAAGQTRSFPLTVPPGMQHLKILLCWSDPAATGNAPKALINDLDLELVNDQTSQVWLPWVLSHFPHADSLQKGAVRKRDTLNNVEQITLNNPAPGNYTVRVKGMSVPEGAQNFVYTWQLNEGNTFQWQFPVSTDNLEGNKDNSVRWYTSFSAATGKLDYSLDAGNTWKAISNAIDLQKGDVYWPTPDTFATALLRMTIGAQTFISDTFTISSRLSARVGFDCADSFMIYWNKPKGVNQFRVFELGGNYLTPFTVTNDTFLVLRKPAHPALHYTVAPVFPSGREGTRSFTFNYTIQGVSCYIRTFLVDPVPPNTAYISFELGTLFGIKNIVIEKQVDGNFTTLQPFPLSGNLQFEHNDRSLAKGYHTYRLKLILENGAVVYSDPATIYSFGEQQYVVFPNPARTTGNLQVLVTGTDVEGLQLLLYTSTGQKVWEQKMLGNITTLPLLGFNKGVHFLVIQQRGKRVFSTGVVIY